MPPETDPWQEAAKNFKPQNGVSAPASGGGNEDWKIWQQQQPSDSGSSSILSKAAGLGKDVAKGLGESAVSLMSTGNHAARKIPGIGEWLTTPITGTPADQAIAHTDQLAKPANTTQAISKGVGQAAQFLIPGGAEEKAASLIPAAARGVGKIGLSALSSGLVNKAQGGDFGTGAAAGGIGAGIGQGLKAVAPTLAESALKVRGNQRLFGRTVGDAILKDTSGIRPETIGKSAGAKIAELTPELDAADQASAAAGKRGSLAPARQAVAGKIAGYQGNRAMGTAGEIQPVADFLKTDQLTKLPLAEQQTAPGLRATKRGLTSDFIGPWRPEESIERKQAARTAYGKINDELHAISPGTKETDQRISSLIPVKQQGERVAAGAPVTQRVLGRVGAHSGALAMGIGGGIEGRREAGTPGMIAGGLTGLIAPELIASPEGQVALARTLYKANGLRPLVGAGLQADRNREEQ